MLIYPTSFAGFELRPELAFTWMSADTVDYFYGVSEVEARPDRPAYSPGSSFEIGAEVLKEITGTGQGLAGHLLIYDAKDARFERVSIAWDPDNALSGRNPVIRDLSIHAEAAAGAACGAPA